MPPTPKRPLEDASKTGTEKLVQAKLNFSRTAPWTTVSSSSSSSTPLRSSSAPSSSRYAYSAPYTAPPSSSRYFSNSSSQRRDPASRRGLFKDRQWVREDSGGASSLSDLSLFDGLDGQETPRKPKPHGARYNAERAAIAKETM
jgi:hypothetical protein